MGNLAFEEIRSTLTETGLHMNFIEFKTIMSYFNLIDMISAIGGISQTLGFVTGYIGFLFIVQFVAQLTGIIHRKEKE